MAKCSYCNGTGECQDPFHKGTFSGDDDGPTLLDNLIGSCESCGSTNTEMRPPCPHCDGTGVDGYF
jgi:hypothetical protein